MFLKRVYWIWLAHLFTRVYHRRNPIYSAPTTSNVIFMRTQQKNNAIKTKQVNVNAFFPFQNNETVLGVRRCAHVCVHKTKMCICWKEIKTLFRKEQLNRKPKWNTCAQQILISSFQSLNVSLDFTFGAFGFGLDLSWPAPHHYRARAMMCTNHTDFLITTRAVG